jgi:hypothetical protein
VKPSRLAKPSWKTFNDKKSPEIYRKKAKCLYTTIDSSISLFLEYRSTIAKLLSLADLSRDATSLGPTSTFYWYFHGMIDKFMQIVVYIE